MDYGIDGNEPKVEKAILHLYRNKLFTDVTVNYSSGKMQFHVHKLILVLYSPVLSNYFYGKSKCNTLDIESTELSAVENMISFCYGEPPVFENIYQIKETKAIAEKYKIVELFNICIKEIDAVEVDMSNVLTVLEMSIQYGKKNKEKECLELISSNRETVFTSELFMKMKFESICQICEKLKEMGSLTEVQYLLSALKHMRCDDIESKEKLLKRIEISKFSIDEFVDVIISFPNVFTGAEISKAFQKIKETPETEERAEIIAERDHMATEAESSDKVVQADNLSSVQENGISNHKKVVTITITGSKEDPTDVLVTIDDGIARRGLRFFIVEDLEDGLFLELLSRGEGDYVFNNVDLSYNSLYFLLSYIQNRKQPLSPFNYLEALKGAFHFQLKKAQEYCVEELNKVTNFDPMFLDGLNQFPCFQEKVASLLISNTKDIALHPNFIICSFELIRSLLLQTKVNISTELELLIITISWLEARNRLQWPHRFALLKEIAFQYLNYSDVEYVSIRYPNFFTESEINSILLYKCVENSENSKSLPKWYNFKTREH